MVIDMTILLCGVAEVNDICEMRHVDCILHTIIRNNSTDAIIYQMQEQLYICSCIVVLLVLRKERGFRIVVAQIQNTM